MPNNNALQKLVAASPNFGFLGTDNPKMLRAIISAECNVFSDPVSALIRIRQFAELMCLEVAAINGVHFNKDMGDSFYSICRDMSHRGDIPRNIYDIFNTLRTSGNEAAHEVEGDKREALQNLSLAYRLAVWFHETHDRFSKRQPKGFRPPPPPVDKSAELEGEIEALKAQLLQIQQQNQTLQTQADTAVELQVQAELEAQQAYDEAQMALELAEETAEEAERELEEWEARLEKLRKESAERTVEEQAETKRRSEQAGSFEHLNLTEAETRKIIDQQLRDAGWIADSLHQSFSRGTRPTEGKNLAIAEWPTATGPCDYALFVGLNPVGVVEAKRRDLDVRQALSESQRYASGLLTEDACEILDGEWGTHRVPFLFASNSRPYNNDMLEQSGIWFHDIRRPNNLPKALKGWYTPQGLMDLLAKDPEAAQSILANESMEYLNLQGRQEQVILSVEEAIVTGFQRMSVSMTSMQSCIQTALGLSYRSVKSKLHRRVLCLVDTNAQGQTVVDTMESTPLECLQTFADIYDLKLLEDVDIEEYTRLQVATVGEMVRRIFLPTSEETPISVDQYDCILWIQSEESIGVSPHDHSQNLRDVIEYFDATCIGWTHPTGQLEPNLFGDLRIVEESRTSVEKPLSHGPITLKAFNDFIEMSSHVILSFDIVNTSPKELTREQLNEIKRALALRGYSEASLRSAWQQQTNQDIAASIIGFIRQQTLGTTLMPYEERVRRAIDKVKTSHTWSRKQLKWLDRIGKQMIEETIVDQEAMDAGLFRKHGGFDRINTVFDGQLDTVLSDLHDAVWNDAG